MTNPFRFKKFEVKQDKVAMKVGTDGVLLGAWANANSPKNILDVGTGCGVMALMLAQRFPKAQISAIDIDQTAVEQAQENFQNSPFSDRLEVQRATLQQFESNTKYDLIVCNPPSSPIQQKPHQVREPPQGTMMYCHYPFCLERVLTFSACKVPFASLYLLERTFN